MHLLKIFLTSYRLSLLFFLCYSIFSLVRCHIFNSLFCFHLMWIFFPFLKWCLFLVFSLLRMMCLNLKHVQVPLKSLLAHSLYHQLHLQRLDLQLIAFLLLCMKVIDPLIIFILFIIFWATIDHLHPRMCLFSLCPLFLFLRVLLKSFHILDDDMQW